MSTMSVKQALEEVLRDMKAMSPEQLRLELDAHKNGEFAKALRLAQDFMVENYSTFSYPITHLQPLFDDENISTSISYSIECLGLFLAANDSSFMLAA